MSKNQYSQLCQSESLPIFMQDWWLDSVCGTDNWQPILVFDKNEKIIGASFYYNKSRYGLRTVTQPFLTPFSGVWFRPSNFESSRKKQQYEADILKEIAKKLPNVAIFAQNFHFSLTNILPFHWSGFKNTIRYTYFFENINDLRVILGNFSMSVRQNIKKGDDLKVIESENTKFLYNLLSNAIQKSKGKLNYSEKNLHTLHINIKKNQSGQIFEIQNTDNETLGSTLIVWDKETAYFLISGDTKKHKSAITVLIWRVLEILDEKGIKKFDFDGSILPHIEPFYRSLGAERKPYFRITKIKNKFLESLLILANKI